MEARGIGARHLALYRGAREGSRFSDNGWITFAAGEASHRPGFLHTRPLVSSSCRTAFDRRNPSASQPLFLRNGTGAIVIHKALYGTASSARSGRSRRRVADRAPSRQSANRLSNSDAARHRNVYHGKCVGPRVIVLQQKGPRSEQFETKESSRTASADWIRLPPLAPDDFSPEPHIKLTPLDFSAD
jgi:hypothetical protein